MQSEFVLISVVEGQSGEIVFDLASKAIRDTLQNVLKIEARNNRIVNFEQNLGAIRRRVCTEFQIRPIGWAIHDCSGPIFLPLGRLNVPMSLFTRLGRAVRLHFPFLGLSILRNSFRGTDPPATKKDEFNDLDYEYAGGEWIKIAAWKCTSSSRDSSMAIKRSVLGIRITWPVAKNALLQK
jgi:hypothetical protein